jgi:hypothetical protein
LSIALGYGAGAGIGYITVPGTNASAEYTYATGANATALGHYASTLGDNSTALGYGASTAATDANAMQLGSSSGLSTLRSRVPLTVTSDERDKADIAPIPAALDFLSMLTPIQYVDNQREKYIPDREALGGEDRALLDAYGMCGYDREAHAAGAKKGERKRAGISAQQIVRALEAASGTADYANIVNDSLHDVGGAAPEGVESKLTVAYASLVPFLVRAAQELAEKVKALEGAPAAAEGGSGQ